MDGDTSFNEALRTLQQSVNVLTRLILQNSKHYFNFKIYSDRYFPLTDDVTELGK